VRFRSKQPMPHPSLRGSVCDEAIHLATEERMNCLVAVLLAMTTGARLAAHTSSRHTRARKNEGMKCHAY
jgi:hypothetical protein